MSLPTKAQVLEWLETRGNTRLSMALRSTKEKEKNWYGKEACYYYKARQLIEDSCSITYVTVTAVDKKGRKSCQKKPTASSVPTARGVRRMSVKNF